MRRVKDYFVMKEMRGTTKWQSPVRMPRAGHGAIYLFVRRPERPVVLGVVNRLE